MNGILPATSVTICLFLNCLHLNICMSGSHRDFTKFVEPMKLPSCAKKKLSNQMLHHKYEIKVLSCKYHMEGKHGFRKIGIIFENNDVKVEYDNSNFI